MKFNVVYVIIIWVDIRKIYISKLNKCLTSIVTFQYHLARWYKLQTHAIAGGPSDLNVGAYTGYRQESLHRELKMTK